MKRYLPVIIIFLLAAFLLFLSQLLWVDVTFPFEKLNQIIFSGLMPEAFFKTAHGSPSDNIRGWFWSENFGWLSTNCYNNYDTDMQQFENCCPSGTLCAQQNPPEDCCPLSSLAGGDYGLNYNPSNHALSGYAWAAENSGEGLGWFCAGSTCPGQSPDGYLSWACVGTRKSDGTCLSDCQEDFNYEETCQSTADPNLKAHWKMNYICSTESGCGNYQYGYTPDSSSSAIHHAFLGPAYPVNSPVLTFGQFNNALSFDGNDDWLRVEDHPDLDLTYNFTIEGWIYLQGSTLSEQIMLRKENAYALGVISSSFDKIQAWLCFEPNCTLNNSWKKFDFEDNILPDYLNKWRHLALTYDGFDVRLYVDGILDSIYCTTNEETEPILINTSGAPLYIGGEENRAHLYGGLDNLAIYTRVKTAQEIWQDAKKEVSGWMKVVSNDSDQGWLKLNLKRIELMERRNYATNCQDRRLASVERSFSFFLDDHSQGGGFYTIGGQNYTEVPPDYYYLWRSWSWSADLDNSNQSYGLGWLSGTHRYSWFWPQQFNQFIAQNLSSGPSPQIQLTWQPSNYAQWYLYYRCDNVEENQCQTCQYTPRPVPFGSCNSISCSMIDSESLQWNTGYCYKIRAFNRLGQKWCTDNPPNHPCPYWIKTSLPRVTNQVLVQGNTCGRLEIYWNPTQEEENYVDGYNLYRSVKANGCDSLRNPDCLLIGHLGETVSYQDLVGYWKLNEASWSGQQGEVKDSSGYLNHGTAYGNAQTTQGKFKRAGIFDGSGDYITINDSDSLDFNSNDSFTFSGWLKTNQTGVILEKISQGPGYRLKINSSGYLGCYLKDSDSQVTATSSVVINDNAWHYFACLANRSNNTLQIYLDGNPNGNPASLTGIDDLSNNDPLKIAGASFYYSGLLDNLSLTKRAKSNNQIRFEAEAKPLSEACQINQDQVFKYSLNENLLNCTTNGPCCQFIDRRITPKTVYYYWLTQLTQAGESEAKAPETNCQRPKTTNYRYGCDKTLCAERVEEKEK